MRKGIWVAAMVMGLGGVAGAQDAKGLIDTLLAHESEASKHRGWYVYLSEERTDRTGGHLWRERVAETAWGDVRFLLAEDGVPLSGERLAAEKSKLAGWSARPEELKRDQAARKDDEQHAKQMLVLLQKAFLFDAPRLDGEYFRVGYRPDPNYQTQTLEEKVLHGMSGTVLIDAKTVRLRGIDGRIPEDMNLAFLSTIHAGSNFSSTRKHLDGYDWKTEMVHTDIKGKALLLKTIARAQEVKHAEFRKIAEGTTVSDAVRMVEQEGTP